MEIGPVNNNQTWPAGAEKEKSYNAKTKGAKSSEDRVEISNEARMKLAALADKVLRETSAAQRQSGVKVAEKGLKKADADPKLEEAVDHQKARLELIRHRIESHFYQQAEVKREVARKLAEEFGQVSNDQEGVEI